LEMKRTLYLCDLRRIPGTRVELRKLGNWGEPSATLVNRRVVPNLYRPSGVRSAWRAVLIIIEFIVSALVAVAYGALVAYAEAHLIATGHPGAAGRLVPVAAADAVVLAAWWAWTTSRRWVSPEGGDTR
jgi:hypothetical protein